VFTVDAYANRLCALLALLVGSCCSAAALFGKLCILPASLINFCVLHAHLYVQVFDAALAGGGAKSINFQELAGDLAQITFDYPFRIPPYFALVIRAIGVLEGIALVGNPDFAIIDEVRQLQ
jgi:predicted unusual protein kinase regulating ubiquinone biosynthesis (AarF/ABC1/UbiB family)